MTGTLASYAGRRVLVLGGAGFIGQWVARALASHGALVHLTVRTDTRPGLQPVTREVIQADLARPGAAIELVRTARPTIVFNLAGYGVDPAERDDVLAERLNTDLVMELASACGDLDDGWPGQHLVHTGSALEYGTASGDLSEESTPQPTTVYGRTKLAGTAGLAAASRAGKLRGVTARLFTVYGPGEHAGRLLPSLIRAAREGTTLALTSGRQQRDFTYVEDVAAGMLRLGLLRDEGLGPVNLATGVLESVRGFTERAADVLGMARSRLRFGELPDRAEEMAHAPVSIARLRALCAWYPTTTIEEGIRRTREYR